jgi:hypothetical protein
MPRRRLRTKYRLNRNHRRMQRIKFAVILLLSAVALAFGVWASLQYFGSGSIQPIQPPDIRLGGD